jgi:hypothetical protein
VKSTYIVTIDSNCTYVSRTGQDSRRKNMQRVETKRKDIRVPVTLIKEVEEYQLRENIPTWTGALLELVRIGLREVNKDKNKE